MHVRSAHLWQSAASMYWPSGEIGNRPRRIPLGSSVRCSALAKLDQPHLMDSDRAGLCSGEISSLAFGEIVEFVWPFSRPHQRTPSGNGNNIMSWSIIATGAVGSILTPRERRVAVRRWRLGISGRRDRRREHPDTVARQPVHHHRVTLSRRDGDAGGLPELFARAVEQPWPAAT